MAGGDGESTATGGSTQPNREKTTAVDAFPTQDGEEEAVTATTASTTDKQQASAPGEATSGVSRANAEIVKRPSLGESAAGNDTASVDQGIDGVDATEPLNGRGVAEVAGEGAAKGQADDEDEESYGPGQGDGVCDGDEDDDDLSSSLEGGKDSNGWGEVEDGERTGYSGAEVEPFAVQEGIDGSCILEVCGTT